VRIRKHRHRWSRRYKGELVEFVYCRTKGCEFGYEQMLLFDPRAYEVAA
jgi:hypothetical protein